MSRRRRFGVIWAGVWALPTAFFGFVYYDMHWRWRDCFNEQGRCFEPEAGIVHHEQSGFFYLLVFLIPLIACVFGLALTFWPSRRAFSEADKSS